MGDRDRWEELYATGARPDRPPSAWVLATVRSLPNELALLDLAGGSGRHGVPLARDGYRVTLVDGSPTAVRAALAGEPRVEGIVADATRLPLRPAAFGIVLVSNFLDRTLFPALLALLAPGGYLVYETYTEAHLGLVARGLARGPTSRNYLLRAGELPTLCAPLPILLHEEGDFTDAAGRRHAARLLAQAP